MVTRDVVETLSDLEKLVLYAVNQSEKGFETETHLQKLMFSIFLALEIDPESQLGYYAHDYGPYSVSVKEASNELLERGYLFQRDNKGFIRNPDMVDVINNLKVGTESDRYKINEIAKFLSELSWEETILHNYVRNPEFTTHSKVKDRVFSRREKIAVNMVKSGRVSISCGAKLAGLSLLDFRNIIGYE